MSYPNWFDGQRYNFENHLLHLAGEPNLKFLQIGAYTGDASVWLLENILTNPTSTLTDIDTWQGSDESEHKSIDFNSVYQFYLVRISKYNNVLAIKSKSEYALPNLNYTYDFIYIDGDHTAKVVAEDAEASWKLLKPNGILAFDDYMWGQDMSPELTPKPAIDDFLNNHVGEYNILNKDYQVWIQKNATL
jgi:hypothetical protein